jgi:hypothetical protein
MEENHKWAEKKIVMAYMETKKIAMFGPKPKVEKGKNPKVAKPKAAPDAKAEEKKAEEEVGTGKNIKELFGRDTGFTNTPE